MPVIPSSSSIADSPRALRLKSWRACHFPDEISGILVTHEHSDHIAGAFKFACRFAVPVYLTHGTGSAAASAKPLLSDCRLIDSQATFAIGDLEIQPFPVPHDAREPVQYVFSDGKHRLGVLTDSGTITPHIVDVLSACDALVLECNHDPEMLLVSSYPAHLKRRIAKFRPSGQRPGGCAFAPDRDAAIAAYCGSASERTEQSPGVGGGCLGLRTALLERLDWRGVSGARF